MCKAVKKPLSFAIILSMILMCFSMPISFAGNEGIFKTDSIIELEEAVLQDNISVDKDSDSSGGRYIVDKTGGEKLADPDSKAPEVLVEFEVEKEGVYYVWLRFQSKDTSQDNYFIGLNDEKINSQYGSAVDILGDGIWGWKMVKSGNLKVGKNTMKMYHREYNLKLDCVYITADAKYTPEGYSKNTPKSSTSAPVSSKPSNVTPAPLSPTGKIYELTNGTVIIEAEDTTRKGEIEVIENNSASNNKMIKFKDVARVDDPVVYGEPAAAYAFKVEKARNYTAWVRGIIKNNGNDSLWSSFDNKPYTQSVLAIGEDDWTWSTLVIGKLEPGVHILNLIPREGGQLIDRILITSESSYMPSGIGEIPSEVNKSYGAPVIYPTPSVLPPKGHPRVYFSKDDIEAILKNAKKPQNEDAWKRHERNLLDNANDTISSLLGSQISNFNAGVLSVIESRAFDFAIRGNEEAGKKAVSAMRDYIDVAEGGDYNQLGQTIFTIAAVYDWCYPLLKDEDKEEFAYAVIDLATQMEIGWPPSNQGAVTGHGVEAQLMRDLMCAGIAMYDEYPDIYNNVAGRFFSEYINSKKFLYKANMNLQGDHYTGYREQWDALATLTMDAIGVPQVFGPEQQYQMYWVLYARKPDGHVFRDGDGGANNRPIGTYNSNFYRSLLHYGNYFSDPYLKWEGMRELPYLRVVSPSLNQSMNCVEFLIFNNPDLEGKPSSELPLTKYFPEPKGAMIARTGWDDGFKSPAVVAEMKVNEYWTANHQHLDAGAFQIYYKGALATDTGYYQAGLRSSAFNTANDGSSDYGGMHFKNYYRRSIAHNTMSVFDPDEPSDNFGGGVNDGGQRMPNRGKEVATIEELLDESNGYKIGEILGHEFGEDPMEPNYTYIKGDLTKAYSDKISDYERSFMFLNLKDKDHPAAILVFDRVAASDESFKKSWLLHGLQEPTINDTQTVFKDTRDGYNGKLTVDTLLPKADNLIIAPIGGSDKEFWVNDTNYFAIPAKGGVNEGGGWRIEVSPKTPSKIDYFLNVLQVGDANPDMLSLPVIAIETDKVAGAVVADRVVVFGKERDRTKDAVEFSFAGDGEFEITVADFEKGTWQVTKDGTALTQASATDEGGVVVFKGNAGSYKLTYVNDSVNRPVIEAVTHQDEGIGIRINNCLIYTDVPPTIQDDRTLVPMRAIFEKLDVSVSYDDATATATAIKDGREVKITQDSKTAYIDGQPVELDVPAAVVNDRFLVPVRFVSEAFYAKVEWDGFAKIVNITPFVKSAQAHTESQSDDYLTIVLCEWSDHFEETVGTQSYDENINTLWSVAGYSGQWILYDLGEVSDVSGASIMWNKGNIRQAIFKINVSEDKKNWTQVYDGKSSGKEEFKFEDFLFPSGTKARYVRIDCGGNTVSEWNAIIEIKFLKNKKLE